MLPVLPIPVSNSNWYWQHWPLATFSHWQHSTKDTHNDKTNLQHRGGFAALKIDLYRDGEPIATLTEFDDLTATDTSISFHLNTNSSREPDGLWWGQRVLLTATIGGFAVKRWLTFANPMP